MTVEIWLWIGFNLFILAMLALDLGVFHREAHVVSFREAMMWVAIWVSLAGIFNLGVWYFAGPEKALEFLTGYLIEESLSVDNVFVWALLFSHFAVPPKYQHRVLFWGVLGALIMRATMIGVGVYLIQKFAWIIYIFGAFLIFTGIKMLLHRDAEMHPEKNPLVLWLRRWLPVTNQYQEDKFFVKVDGKKMATPLFIVLICVEVSDVIFAVDSIPAIFAVTRDPFIVYTSNVFAILGLRSLYFAIGGLMGKFRYLNVGLGVILSFVGVKMLLGHTAWKISTPVSLGVVASVLIIAVIASILNPAKPPPELDGIDPAREKPPGHPPTVEEDEAEKRSEEGAV